LKAVTDDAECSICTEVFTDPRVLPCLHTYCLKCIKYQGLVQGQTAWRRSSMSAMQERKHHSGERARRIAEEFLGGENASRP